MSIEVRESDKKEIKRLRQEIERLEDEIESVKRKQESETGFSDEFLAEIISALLGREHGINFCNSAWLRVFTSLARHGYAIETLEYKQKDVTWWYYDFTETGRLWAQEYLKGYEAL